jgi:predicted nucleic acid-binding protein
MGHSDSCLVYDRATCPPRTRVNDLWIAAQAMENDYALLTADLKDFEGLAGLCVSCP